MIDGHKTALIAEDNAALRRVIEFAIKATGFEVTCASDGVAAWKVAESTRFDLIVTDHQMPGMTGLEMVALVRESKLNRETPVVLLTAKGMEFNSEKVCQQHGVDAVLQKPFSPSRLGALCEQLVGQPA